MGKGLALLGVPILSKKTFSPLDISGLALWLDANDSTTLFQDSAGTTPAVANSDPIGLWKDKSGNARNFSQATTSLKPGLLLNAQNGKPGILFDGNDDVLSATLNLSQPTTYYFIAKWVDSNFLFDGSGSTRNCMYAVTPSFFAGSEIVISVSVQGTAIWSVCFNGASSFGWKNGTQIASGDAGAQSIGTLRLATGSGGSVGDASVCEFYEFMIYSDALSAGNRALLESYLNSKWAVY